MKPARRLLAGGAVTAALLTGGAVGATMVGTAGAATSTTPTPAAAAPATGTAPTNAQPPGGPRGTPDWSKGGHQANGKTETVLTGTELAKATAAAKKAVPGGTVQRAETDAEGAAYEVHMTKSDGSVVTVKMDSSFTVTSTLDGMG